MTTKGDIRTGAIEIKSYHWSPNPESPNDLSMLIIRYEDSVRRTLTRKYALSSTNMQDDPRNVARLGNDRTDKDMKTFYELHWAREKKTDPASVINDATASLELLEPVMQAAELKKVKEYTSESRQEAQGTTASALKSFYNQMKKWIPALTWLRLADALEQCHSKRQAGLEDGHGLRSLKECNGDTLSDSRRWHGQS